MVGKSWDQLDRVPAIRSAILWQYNNNKQQKDKKNQKSKIKCLQVKDLLCKTSSSTSTLPASRAMSSMLLHVQKHSGYHVVPIQK
jgi:hypothetical protein